MSNIIDVIASIKKAIVASGLYTSNNVILCTDEEFNAAWPLVSAPFCLLALDSQYRIGEEDGGGRYVKTWTSLIKIKSVCKNILDIPFVDTSASLAGPSGLSVYETSHRLVDALEQSFPTDEDGNLTLREPPMIKIMGAAEREDDSYQNVSIITEWEISWQQDLPADVPLNQPQGITEVSPSWQPTTLKKVIWSLRRTLIDQGLFTNNNIFFSVAPNIQKPWMLIGSPTCVIEVGRQEDVGYEGGGRYTKTWESDIVFHLMVRNIMDVSGTQTSALYARDPKVGIHALCDSFVNFIEQVYPLDQEGHLTLTELPIVNIVGGAHRFGDAYEYIRIPVYTGLKWTQDLPGAYP